VRRPDRLTVALVQALPSDDESLEPWRGGTLVFDEGHHAAAGTWQELIRRLAPRNHYYLSAVPFRSGRDQAVLDALAGERLTGGRYSAQFLIERGYACPVTVRVLRCRIEGEMTEKPFAEVYREFVVENAARNRRIAGEARREAAAGRSVLVLVDHVRHGRNVRRLLGEEARFVHGSTPRGALRRATAAFSVGDLPCLVATAGLFQEGVSIDGIHALVMGGGLRSRAKVIQSVGRGMRRAPGKEACLYVDFWDDDEAGILRRHSRERFRVLKEEGFQVPPLPAAPEPEEEPIPATWGHVPGTRRFVKVDGEGEVLAKATCLRRDVVPESFCERCRDRSVCTRGGKKGWRGDRD
jgi:superfamily II DNA or RNA helicase